jgi:hypothetical protein
VLATSKCELFKIPLKLFFRVLKPNSLFGLAIARNLLVKDNIFRHLNKFKNYVRQLVTLKTVDQTKLLTLFKKINSSLHPKCLLDEIDISSWLYAIRRLPSNVTKTFIFFVSTKFPDMLSHPEIVMPIKSSARPRGIFQVLHGKCIVILRDLETDLFDFMANLCIHIVESTKLLEKLESPLIVITEFGLFIFRSGI